MFDTNILLKYTQNYKKKLLTHLNWQDAACFQRRILTVPKQRRIEKDFICRQHVYDDLS